MQNLRYAVAQTATCQVIGIFADARQVTAFLARHGQRIGDWTVKGGAHCHRATDMTGNFFHLVEMIRARFGLTGDEPPPSSGPLVRPDDPILNVPIQGRTIPRRELLCQNEHLIYRRKGLRPSRST